MTRRSLPVVALAAAALLAIPALAAAHSELVDSTPAAGENLDSAPDEVTLTFSEELDTDTSSFTVTDADGHEVGDGSVDLTVADRNVMTGAVTISDPGVYTVSYAAGSIDGHVEEGSFSFGYQADEGIPEPSTHEEEAPDTALPAGGSRTPIAVAAGTLLLLAAGFLAARRLALR